MNTTDTSRMRMAMWLGTPLTTGAVIMSMEIAAFRLYAPYFGYSIYVWTVLISVVMAALAAGYALGGRFADHCQTDLPLYGTILLSAAYQFIIVCIAHSLLNRLARLGDVTGAGLATLIVFAPPMIALAQVGPFVIRLLARSNRVGATAGKVYALSTIGSIGGIIATSFFLIPRFGTQAALLTACVVTAVVGMAGITARKRAALLALAPFAALPLVPQATWPANTIWASESAYNLVRVVRGGNRLLLVLNDEHSVHTIRNEATVWTGYYYDYFALGPLLTQANNMLVLGMGAGGSIIATRATAPDIQIDAVEIDQKVVDAGVRFFGLPREADWLRIHVADARPWLAHDEGKYDLIQVDLYQGGPYVPFYLATAEFFQMARAHMTEDGLLMMNVFDVSRNRELLFSMAATLKRIFPSVAVLSVGSSNHMVFAFAQERSIASVRSLFSRAESSDMVNRLAREAARRIDDLNPPDGTPVFTDDHAPIEEITRRMLADYD
jgi:spermidine synthase